MKNAYLIFRKSLFAVFFLFSPFSACNSDMNLAGDIEAVDIRMMERDDHKYCIGRGLEVSDSKTIDTQLYWECRLNLLTSRKIEQQMTSEDLRYNAKLDEMAANVREKVRQLREMNYDKIDKNIEAVDHRICATKAQLVSIVQTKVSIYQKCRHELAEARTLPSPYLVNLKREAVIPENLRPKQYDDSPFAPTDLDLFWQDKGKYQLDTTRDLGKNVTLETTSEPEKKRNDIVLPIEPEKKGGDVILPAEPVAPVIKMEDMLAIPPATTTPPLALEFEKKASPSNSCSEEISTKVAQKTSEENAACVARSIDTLPDALTIGTANNPPSYNTTKLATAREQFIKECMNDAKERLDKYKTRLTAKCENK